MKDSILIGNGVNNLSNSKSWEELVKEIINLTDTDVNLSSQKPFPLLYEEIFMKSQLYVDKERELKSEIGKIVNQISSNETHEAFLELNCENYMTTNYDYVLEKVLAPNSETLSFQNMATIQEKKFNLFRRSQINDKNIWHIHGASNIPRSITLGFEHYGGQLQRLRNYVVNGTNYKTHFQYKTPLHKRLETNKVDHKSWVDLFYTSNVHIVGLNLGYEETDLWWLLTDRARFFRKRRNMSKNKITYYCPYPYKDQGKTELMNAMDIETSFINASGKEFYNEVIAQIKHSSQ